MKILVRVPQWLGDAVVSTVFLARLKERFPHAEIDVLTPAPLRSLFENCPSVHSVLAPAPSEPKSVWAMARLIRGKGYDKAYVLPRSFRTALEPWLAKIPQRIGYSGDLRRFLLTHVFSYDENMLYAHRYLKLIGEENISLENIRPFFPKIDLTDAEARSLLGGSFVDFKKPFLGMAPASVAPARTWDSDRFAETANRFLSERGGTVFLFGSPQEAAVTGQIAAKIKGPVVDTAGKLDLPRLGGVMSRMTVLLANDSGLMHVASALQIPTVVLFGPSDPTWALPRTGFFKAIQRTEVPCVPCLRNHCVRLGSDHGACMKAIGPDQVLSMINEAVR